MSQSNNCAAAQALFPGEYYRNEVAAELAIAGIAMTYVVYLWNILCVAGQAFRRPKMPRQPKHKRYDMDVNLLSGLLCAVVGLNLILSSWPQPLEVAAILVVVLAQASALGWQDLDPKHSLLRKMGPLGGKLADAFGVVVAAYALGDARARYIETPPYNGFQGDHDPAREYVLAYVLTGVATGIGTLKVLFSREDWDQGILIASSIMFFLAQIFVTGATIWFTRTTLAEGCEIFNASKICAMVALCLGSLYSLSLVYLRLKREPVDQDQVVSMDLAL